MNQTMFGLEMTGSTDVVALILIFIVALLVLAVLIVAFVILRKRYMRNRVKFNILRKDGKVDTKRIADVEPINTVEGKKYVFDADALVYRFWGREIYYFHGVKEPINFKQIREAVPHQEMTALELQKVIEEKITEKILSEKGMDKGDILLVLVIVAQALSLYFLFKMSGGVVIGNTPENIELLKEVFKSVVTGG